MKKIKSYVLSIPNQIEIHILNYGGIIQKLLVPDKFGKMDDVVLGFDNPEDYMKEHPYFGALIGRYANRIAESKFSIEGRDYSLSKNQGPNSLHGGLIGLDRVFWEVEINPDGRSCILSHESPDGHEGYPGKLKIEVTYTLASHKELVIDYKATTDRPTHINLTNHSYFNLGGSQSENILDHELWINADTYTAVDKQLIPTGEIVSVKGALDFREHKTIRKDMEQIGEGYDHNFVLNDAPFRDPKARIYHPPSGRTMEVFTTEPGLQFYSGHLLDGKLLGKNKSRYHKYRGLCLETQHFPDSPHHPQFPSTLLMPGDVFQSKTIYTFN